jgi:hypothetical protein
MPDALQRHMEATLAINWVEPTPDLVQRISTIKPVSHLQDAHLKYIEQFDIKRSVQQANNFQNALFLARNDARTLNQLSFSTIQNWQGIVLGKSIAPFRNGPAFAKGGLEVYGFRANTEIIFSNKIHLDFEDSAHPICKAIRSYLDICFFHPFEDGNSRAARLIFDFYTTRGGLIMKDVRPLFSLPRVAGRVDDYLDFLRLAIILCEKK